MLKGVCILGIFGTLLFAQSDTASLTGNVTDPSGAAVTGAKVSLRNLSTGSRRLTVSDVQGAYHFSLLVPGPYEITVESAGFTAHKDEPDRAAGRAVRPPRYPVANRPDHRIHRGEDDGFAAEHGHRGARHCDLPGEDRVAAAQRPAVPATGVAGARRQSGRTGRAAESVPPGHDGRPQHLRRPHQQYELPAGRRHQPRSRLQHAESISPRSTRFRNSRCRPPCSAPNTGAPAARSTSPPSPGSNDLHGSAWEFIRNNDLDARPFNLPSSNTPKFQRNQFGGTRGRAHPPQQAVRVSLLRAARPSARPPPA